MNLATILGALPTIGTLITAGSAVKTLWDEAVATLAPVDQETAKAALADIQADNDEGHARFQRKLAEAAAR